MFKLALLCLCVLPFPRETELMVEAGKAANAGAVVTGTLNADFVRAAEVHATLQAAHNRQGHPQWVRRYRDLHRMYPRVQIAEIASQSWRGQTMAEAATDAFTVSWPASPGHWMIANKKAIFYGASMRRGSNGIIYTSMIVGYLDTQQD